MRSKQMLLQVLSLMLLASCGAKPLQDKTDESRPMALDGVVGTTCYAKPVVRDRQGLNVCSAPAANWPGLSRGELFYGPLAAMFARSSAVKACKDANALDEGVQFGKSCFQTCETVVNCIPFTPNP